MDDIFIPPTKINRAMDGDTVLVEVHQSKGDHKGKVEGEVKTIETHSVTKWLVPIVKHVISVLYTRRYLYSKRSKSWSR